MDKEFLNSKKAMTEFLNYAASSPDTAKAPFMIDSSDFEVIKSGLKCVQGKSIVNSISLKHGGKIFLEQAEEINNYGAAIAAAAFDEEGQASDTKRRVSICRRAYKLLKSINIPDENIIFDLNIFPLASGIKEHDMSAVSFIESCRIIKSEMPGVLILGGISNLSFSFRGLKQTRAALNSIFLHYAAAAGLDTAIVNANQLVKYEDIEEPLKSLCEAVIFNTSEDAGEKLLEYSLKMEQKNNAASVQPRTDSRQKLSVEERLQNALIKGTSEFLEEDIKEALKIYTPLEIIEKPLLTGMNKIGELFADGRMFLPQIIKSAHIMKQASGIVKRYMPDAAAEKPAGIIVLASVKGDVHDIGKNILSLVLSCSGFKTVDLGVMVSCSAILEAAREQNADIIGLSGLIMPSLNEMIYNAEQLDKSGLNLPALMIGGAASSALHTALKIAPEYRGITVYIKSASEAASIAHKIIKKDAEFINALKSEQQRLREEYEKKHN